MLQRKKEDAALDSPDYWENFAKKANARGYSECHKCHRMLNSRVMYHHRDYSYAKKEEYERREYFCGKDDKVKRTDIYTCYRCGGDTEELGPALKKIVEGAMNYKKSRSVAQTSAVRRPFLDIEIPGCQIV